MEGVGGAAEGRGQEGISPLVTGGRGRGEVPRNRDLGVLGDKGAGVRQRRGTRGCPPRPPFYFYRYRENFIFGIGVRTHSRAHSLVVSAPVSLEV